MKHLHFTLLQEINILIMKNYILSILCSLPFALSAQFVSTGGPTVSNLKCKTVWAQGDTIFMGMDENLYRTFNGGIHWTNLTNGIPEDSDPRTIEYSNGVLIVGTNDDARIYTSSNWGDSFTGGTGAMNGILVPTSSSSGSNSIFLGGTNSEPYRYDFSNNNWVATTGNGGITHGLTQTGIDTVWQCTGGVTSGTTQYSYDNGVSWAAVSNEPNTDIGGGVIMNTIAQDFLTVGNRVIVATNFNGFPILYSDDNGSTWINSGVGGYNWSDYGKKFMKISNNHILATTVGGIWKSIDQGTTWTLTPAPHGAVYSMVRGKGDHILLATNQGLFEYENYGEGNLVKQHGVPATPSNLVVGPSNNIWVGSSGGVFKYTKAPGSWSLINDQYNGSSSLKMDVEYISFIGDTLYACGQNLYTSGDNGANFTKREHQEFAFQRPNRIMEIGNKIFLTSRQYWTGSGTPHTPKIWYSTNGSTSYTEATFTNLVSWGLGAASDNYIEEIYETSTALIADMNAGYAISTDVGLTWTFYGDGFTETKIATLGNTIYKYTNSMFSKKLELSTDDGTSWSSLPISGLPNTSGTNSAYYGVFETNGIIYTYNVKEAPFGLYSLDVSNSNWTLVPDSEGPLSETITGLYYLNNELFANFFKDGTWSSAGSINSINSAEHQSKITVYPNPNNGIFNLDIANTLGKIKVEIIDIKGAIVFEGKIQESSKIQTNLHPGIYFIRVIRNNIITSAVITIQ
jgi:hypothetical protein